MNNLQMIGLGGAIIAFAFFIRMMHKTLFCKYCGGKIESYSGKKWICVDCKGIQ